MWPQCCTSAAALPASQPDLDTPQLYLVMLFCYLPSLWWPQKAYNAKIIYDKTEICPLAGAGDGAGSWCYLAVPRARTSDPSLAPILDIYWALSTRK